MIVPVPSKDAIVGIGEEVETRAVEVVMDCIGDDAGLPIFDAVRFTEEIAKASSGGPRSANLIYQKLEVDAPRRRRPIVLVDDVLTSGGHMKAIRQKLVDEGCNVACGIVCGKTEENPDLDPGRAGAIEIDDSVKPSTNLDF